MHWGYACSVQIVFTLTDILMRPQQRAQDLRIHSCCINVILLSSVDLNLRVFSLGIITKLELFPEHPCASNKNLARVSWSAIKACRSYDGVLGIIHMHGNRLVLFHFVFGLCSYNISTSTWPNWNCPVRQRNKTRKAGAFSNISQPSFKASSVF